MTDSQTGNSLAYTAIERRYRTMVRLNLALILGLAVACVSSAAKPDAGNAPKDIRASAFVLVDANGKERGRFACAEGGASIGMWNAAGDTAVQLGVRNETVLSGRSSVSFSGLSLKGIESSVDDTAGETRPVSFLSMASATSEGEKSEANFVCTGTENIWVANHRGKDGYEGNAFMLNSDAVTIMRVEGEGPEGFSGATLGAGAEGGSVSVHNNDDFEVNLSSYEGHAAVVLSREEASGPELELQLTEDHATITMKDSKGEPIASYPK